MVVQALPEPPERTEAQRRLIEDAAELANDIEPGSEPIGYVLITMYADGGERVASYRPKLETLVEGPPRWLGRSLWVAWAHKALDSFVAYAEGADAVNRSWEENGFVLAPPDDDPA